MTATKEEHGLAIRILFKMHGSALLRQPMMNRCPTRAGTSLRNVASVKVEAEAMLA